MILGVVGNAADKFTERTERLAREAIFEALDDYNVERIVSGGCHLGGVDHWGEEIAVYQGIPLTVHRPTRLEWSVPGGYKERNLRIAKDSDLVLVVVAASYPEGYTGMRFDECYHCRGRNPPHVKSGGCWTGWKCKNRIWRII